MAVSVGGGRRGGASPLLLRGLVGFVLLASLANSVPSRAQLFPRHALGGLTEDDLSGSGYETRDEGAEAETATRDDGPDSPAARIARQWRDMAIRARRQARLLDEPERKVLLDLAEEYDARALRLETRRARS